MIACAAVLKEAEACGSVPVLKRMTATEVRGDHDEAVAIVPHVEFMCFERSVMHAFCGFFVFV